MVSMSYLVHHLWLMVVIYIFFHLILVQRCILVSGFLSIEILGLYLCVYVNIVVGFGCVVKIETKMVYKVLLT